MTGQFCWMELTTGDDAAAREFYRGMFGWTYRNASPDGAPAYHMFEPADGALGGGIMTKPRTELPTAWMPYISVDDLGAAVARARELGGTVQVEPMPVPGHGRFAVIQDPTGGVVGLWKNES